GDTGVPIAIDNPHEMGADRIVDALAAAKLYRVPAIIVDFGTATTFDAVDRDCRLLGTSLAPGLRTAMDGLFQRAARLSRIELEKDRKSTRLNSSHQIISYAVFCLKKKGDGSAWTCPC